MKFKNLALALSLLAALPLPAQTLIHYTLNATDAGTVAGGIVPNSGTLGNGTNGGTGITLTIDIPVNGVPPGDGNRAMVFNGAGGVLAPGTLQLSRTNIANAGGFTYEAWFKWNGGGNINAIIDYAGTEKLIRQSIDPGPSMETDNSMLNLIGTAASNEWHYAAVVFTPTNALAGDTISGKYTFYLDTNQPVATVSNITINSFGDSLNRTIGVGAHPAGFSSDYFNGLIYEPRVTLGAVPSYGLLFKPGVVVTTTNDSGAGSLRAAIAGAPNGAAITFAPALNGQTILLSGPLTLNQNLTIDASTLPAGIQINGNQAGSVLSVTGGNVVLTALTITNGLGDNGGNGGGGIYNTANLTVNRCTLAGNSTAGTGNGGGILNSFGTLVVNQSTLAGNLATGNGGGAIFNINGTLTVNQSTLTGNSSTDSGGGIYLLGGSGTISNSIVAGNSATGLGANIYVSGTLTLTGSNLVSGDPQLAPLGNYGGPTPTMPPLPGSPAIDAGIVIAGVSTDQRGSARVVGAAPDIGAVESGGLWVQNTNDPGANSLRDVLASAAAVTDPKIILFTSNLSGATITLAGSALTVTDTYGVTIDASSLPGGIQINANSASRVLYVSNGAVATVKELTIANGRAHSGDFSVNGGGGGIFCLGRLNLLNCSVISNIVTGSGLSNSYAGAIACDGGYVGLTNCTIASNTVFGVSSGFGGAFYNFNGTFVADQCTIASNRAFAVNGGVADGGSTSLRATVLANGNTDFQNYSGGSSLGNNFIADGTSSGFVNGFEGDHVGTAGSPLNALLAPLGNYGGPTPTLPPLPGSPLVDAAGVADVATDQRGYPRPAGLAADIGAVEGIYNPAGPGKLTGPTKLPNGLIQLGFTNYTDAIFTVVATTNVTQPLSNWTQIGFAIETPPGSGHFQFTDPQAPNFPTRFYRIKSP